MWWKCSFLARNCYNGTSRFDNSESTPVYIYNWCISLTCSLGQQTHTLGTVTDNQDEAGGQLGLNYARLCNKKGKDKTHNFLASENGMSEAIQLKMGIRFNAFVLINGL